MTLLIIYVLIALVFSFLCSIAEAVILSVTPAYIALRKEQHPRSARMLKTLKTDINKPLAAILTLNTIAHTVGAAGAGAQAAAVFGDPYVGIASAILTLLILIFSEIIPKTLGAYYWRRLAPATAYVLRILIVLLYPFVILSQWLTDRMTSEPHAHGLSRDEFAAMAKVSHREGELNRKESDIMQNLLLMRSTQVSNAMTPRSVVFVLPEALTISEYFQQHHQQSFSRIPVFAEDRAQPTGFVLRSDLILAKARDEHDRSLREFRRKLPAILDAHTLSQALDEMMRLRAHMLLVVDEYGAMHGLLTLEDALEMLLGVEIVDESDRVANMRRLARRLWKQRAKQRGITNPGKPQNDD